MREHFTSMGPMRREFILTLVENHLSSLLLHADAAHDKAYHKLSLTTTLDELYYLRIADARGRIGINQSETYCIPQRFKERGMALGVFNQPYTLPGFEGVPTLAYNTARWMYLMNGLNLENREKIEKIKTFPQLKPCELVIMIGTPGAGKSTWAKDNFPQMDYICMDEIRKEVCGNTADQTRNVEVAKVGFARLYESLRARRSVIWDATSPTMKQRKGLIDAARQQGAYVTEIWMDTSLKTSLLRNASRERVVPEDVLRKKHSQLQFPRSYEYDRLLLVEEVKNVKWSPNA